MAATGDIESIIELYGNGLEVEPALIEQTFTTAVTTSMNNIDVAASASDATVPIGNKGTIKELRITTDYTSTDYITCKINGQSTSWTVNPIQVFTENVTSLTVSNADTASAKVINVEIISTTS